MADTPLLSVFDARSKILAALHTVPSETVPLSQAHGRVLTEDAIARRTQPPA
ncbi:MAG: molybdopterin molybdenumtransferase MoeA, partial [Parvibaculum sp.]|nr:molybdopterin molybdenumtransferase MoeA [Parvibaculum sp.]